MQKQKTIAKWLAIILLATISISGYLVYDAIANKQGNTALGENGSGAIENDKEQSQKEKYHTSLPRESEEIDGIIVSHVGGEKDDILKKVIALNDKFFVFFESKSEEYDVEKNGLYLAYFSGRKLEKTLYVTDADFVDCKLMPSGVCLITKGEKNNAYLINQSGEIIARNTTPDFDECTLFLSFGTLDAYFIKDGVLTMAKIENNLDFETSNFVFSVGDFHVKNIFQTADDTKLILENDADSVCTKIVGFSRDKGFNVDFIADKISFLRIFTLGNVETNYIFCGKSQGRITLLSMDNHFNLTAKKTLDEDDGIFISTSTNFKVVCDDFTYEFCRHLDLQSKTNSTNLNEKIKYYDDKFVVTYRDGNDVISTHNNVCLAIINSCENYRLIESNGNLFVFLQTSSNDGLFRANFGENDIYFLTICDNDG